MLSTFFPSGHVFRSQPGDPHTTLPHYSGDDQCGLLVRPPDEANPLLNVISQTDPESFPSDFGQPSQAKLSQADFLLIQALGNSATPARCL